MPPPPPPPPHRPGSNTYYSPNSNPPVFLLTSDPHPFHAPTRHMIHTQSSSHSEEGLRGGCHGGSRTRARRRGLSSSRAERTSCCRDARSLCRQWRCGDLSKLTDARGSSQKQAGPPRLEVRCVVLSCRVESERVGAGRSPRFPRPRRPLHSRTPRPPPRPRQPAEPAT
jgi:hypothetical protein